MLYPAEEEPLAHLPADWSSLSEKSAPFSAEALINQLTWLDVYTRNSNFLTYAVVFGFISSYTRGWTYIYVNDIINLYSDYSQNTFWAKNVYHIWVHCLIDVYIRPTTCASGYEKLWY